MRAAQTACAANWPHVRLLAALPGRDIEAGMLFWVTASLLTIGAILSVLVPIARRSPDGSSRPRTTSKSTATSFPSLIAMPRAA